MAIVSISEAARLIGKSRTTVQRSIAAGKISRAANGDGVDTAELIRVFGELKSAPVQGAAKQKMLQHAAPKNDAVHSALNMEILHLKELLKTQEENAKKLLEAKDKHIESLDNAMRLIEDQRQKTPQSQPEEPRGFLKRLFNF